MQKRSSKKALALVLASVVCLAVVAGGVYMWLIDKDGPIKNTFTIGNVDITLTEQAGGTDKEFPMVPDKKMVKDPLVTVVGGSEKCYVFVQAVEAGGNVTVGGVTKSFSDFVEYEVDGSIWTAVPNQTGWYYQVVDESSADQAFDVLKKKWKTDSTLSANDAQIHIKDSVTKEMMDALKAAGPSALPTLTFNAAAVQYDGMADVADAFSKVTA